LELAKDEAFFGPEFVDAFFFPRVFGPAAGGMRAPRAIISSGEGALSAAVVLVRAMVVRME